MSRVKVNLRSKDAARLKKAARWLRKGRPMRALTQLRKLPDAALSHLRTQQIIWRAATMIF